MSNLGVNESKREYFPQLTSVRFFAALIVILYHYDDEILPYLPGLAKNVVVHGYVGVSFFFVLSGFIIASNYYDRLVEKKVKNKDFWFARFARIYPLFLISVLISLPRFLVPLAKDPHPEEAVFALAHPIQTILVTVLGLQSLGVQGGSYLNNPSWSISTELGFYLLMPIMVPVIARIKTKHLSVALACLTVFAGVFPFLHHSMLLTINLPKLGIEYTSELNSFIFHSVRTNPLFRLPEFLAGILAFRVYREILKNVASRQILWAGLIASIPFFYEILFEERAEMLQTPLYSGQFLGIPLFLTLILWLVTSSAKPIQWLKLPKWVLLGEASFALYLFHIPIKHFGRYILASRLEIDKNNIWLCLLLIVFSIWFSTVLFSKIENPCRKKLMAWWKQRNAVISAHTD
jgi:peptidoglycan/LPS O-acetylase OafA/YrhL